MIEQTFTFDLAKENTGVISLFRGDTHAVKVYVKNNDAKFDLTGYTGILSVKQKLSDLSYQLQLSDSKVTYNLETGLITITFASTDTENLRAGNYVYDIQISNSTNVYTLLQDAIEIKGELSNPTYTVTNAVGYIYVKGNVDTNGSWRLSAEISGNLLFEKRIAGVWTEMGKVS